MKFGLRTLGILGVLLLVAAVMLAAEQQNAANQGSSDISFTLVKQTNGKPVKYATIVLHTVDKNGRMSDGGINLKSDSDGKAEFRGLPYGKLRIQVIAKGFQTFGEDFDISKPTHEFTIKLAPPKEQYSIYK